MLMVTRLGDGVKKYSAVLLVERAAGFIPAVGRDGGDKPRRSLIPLPKKIFEHFFRAAHTTCSTTGVGL